MTTVNDLLKAKEQRVYSILPQTTLLQVVKTLGQYKVGALLVVDPQGKLIGIVSERDIVRKAQDGFSTIEKITASEIMTKDIVVGVATDDMSYVMNIMTKNKIRHLPIMDGSKIIGVITIGDVVKAMLSEEKYENRMLRDYIEGKYPA
ncbi:MAG: CBS domain-containing protein [Deltaproteobacteria bacterium]|nr:CBS domain-containing protein [Deltaproteobacteria bacterium]